MGALLTLLPFLLTPPPSFLKKSVVKITILFCAYPLLFWRRLAKDRGA
jgi:hypothetical protein